MDNAKPAPAPTANEWVRMGIQIRSGGKIHGGVVTMVNGRPAHPMMTCGCVGSHRGIDYVAGYFDAVRVNCRR